MLANRLYLGETYFRDVTGEGAHPALIEPEVFEQCQAILEVRGDARSQRAASNSDYYLTGRITCPKCGRKYIGTSATGKLRRYRYYTCFTRARYGTVGCTAARIDADLIDRAITEALIDFYGRTDLIHDAIEAERQLRTADSSQHQAERKAIDAQISAAETAIDRYLTAFENGTLDERTCGHRVNDLTAKLGQLRAHRDQLDDLVNDLPTPPSPQAIQRLQRQLAHVLRHGTHGQKKAVIETHIAEIKIDDTQLIPVFKIPTGHDTDLDPGNDDGPDDESTDPEFRTMVRVVDLLERYCNRPGTLVDLQYAAQQIARGLAKPQPRRSVGSPGQLRHSQRLQDRLSEDDWRGLIQDRQAGLSQKATATKYGISQSSVKRIMRLQRATKKIIDCA